MDEHGTAFVIFVLVAVALVVSARWAFAVARGRAAASMPNIAFAPPSRWPTVSVIVPAWAELGTIERCLQSLAAVDYPDWEIIVVAGGDDGTFEAAVASSAQLAHCRVVQQHPGGKPAAMNVGLRLATGEIVVLLDADSEVDSSWLRALVAPLGPGVAASTGNPQPARLTPVSRVEVLERVSAYGVRRRFVLQGSGSIAVRRADLEALGGFPAHAFADDWDLDARLAARGLGRAFAPGARLRTERPSTVAEFWSNELRWRRAHLASIAQYPGYFLGGAGRALRELFPYVVAWAVAVATLVTVVLVVLGDSPVRTAAALSWLIGMAGVLLERAALAIEVVAFTGHRGRLRDAWALPVLWVVTLTCALIASLTIERATLTFKGPRHPTKMAAGTSTSRRPAASASLDNDPR